MRSSEPTLALFPEVPAREVWQRLAWVGIYAIAMGLLEAICVIYLRRLFPFENVPSAEPIPPLDRLTIEVIREACTMVMLVAVAWLGGFNLRTRAACFFYAFGVWDIVYYAGLKWLGHWPSSWVEWDCLFLIPKPWYGPVLAPMLISAYFAVACWFLHTQEIRRKPLRMSPGPLSLQASAAIVWYWSFVKDADQITAHGYAGVRYAWEFLIAGMIVGCAGLWLAARAPVPQKA
jgi:hypothetical protein